MALHPFAQTLPEQVPGVPGQSWVCAAGQEGPVPGQLAASVATPDVQDAVRQDVDALLKASVGQALFVPSHLSSTSQMSTALRQTKVVDCLESVQVEDVPVHLSSTSQGPAATRHTVFALPGE